MELWKVFFCVSADQILPKQKVFPFQIFMFAQAQNFASFLLVIYLINSCLFNKQPRNKINPV